jgi:holliday junction DNA helicase RuvA
VAPTPQVAAATAVAPQGLGARMIASVRGEVVSRLAGEVVIEAAGVGYRMAVSTETLTSVPAAGEQARLFTHLVLRDDGMHLFGFATQAERELFLMLIGVQSVGPKVALAVLSGGTPRELLNAIASGDSARFQAVPGIGKRTAERIMVELREKVAGALEEAVAAGAAEGADARGLARDGLINLGYTPAEAEELLDGGASDDPEELIAAALRRAGESKAGAAG